MAVIPDTHNTGLTPTQIDTAFSNALTHTPSSSTPVMDGTGAAGTADTFARGDHVHPHDTTKQDTVLGSWTPDTSATHQTPAGTDTVLEALQKIDRNQRADETNILLLETMNGAKNLAPFNSGAHTGNAMYWFAHPNCIDIAENTSVYLVFDYTQTSGQYSVQLTNANGDALTSTLAYTTSNTTSGHVVKKVTVPSGITAKGYSSYHNTNATVTISNFMIVPAEIYEAGFTDYQPYAMSNVELTAAIQAIQAQLANS